MQSTQPIWRLWAFGLVSALSLSEAAIAEAVGGSEYFIGRDRRETLNFGTYNGLANPNLGRLTMLWNDVDHFHGIGAYSYTGPVGSPTVASTNSNNRIPETSSLQAPLLLSLGSGSLFGDKLVNQHEPTIQYSDISFRAIDALYGSAAGSPEDVLLNSSLGRWSGSLAGTAIAIELISISNGLNVGDVDTLNLFESNPVYSLGAGDDVDFVPVFWTMSGAAPGTYSATFRFLDVGSAGVLSAGGTFSFDFAPAPVPLPAAGWLLAGALAPLLRTRRVATKAARS